MGMGMGVGGMGYDCGPRTRAAQSKAKLIAENASILKSRKRKKAPLKRGF